jgi:hypothetical protein
MIDDRRSHFEAAWPWLQAALEIYPLRTHDKAHVWHAIVTGEAQLWTCETAALVTEITVYPTGVKVLNAWLAGGDMAGVVALNNAADDYARAVDCTARSISGRRGWLRVFDGYEDAATMMAKRL